MAPVPKPIFKPEWATIIGVYGLKTNAIEPPAGRKPEGWQYREKPPRNYLNWLHHYTGEWIDYLEAATAAGKMPATKVVAAVNASDQWRQSADLVLEAIDNQAALISALIAALPAGGRLLFSDGTFTLTQPIVVVGLGLVLQGQGLTTRFTNEYAAAGGVFCFTAANQYGIRFFDFEMESDLGVAGATWSNGIYLDTCFDVSIHRVDVFNLHGGPSTHGAPNVPKGVAIMAEASRVSISDCHLSPTSLAATQSGEGIWGINSELVVDGVTMVDDAWGGGSVAPSAAGIYTDNHVKISHCTISHMAFGMILDGAANSIVEGNTITDVTTDGIELLGCDHVYLTDNDIDGAGVCAIETDGTCSHCQIKGGQCQTSPTGILMSGQSCSIACVDIESVTVGIYLFVAAGTVNKTKINDCRIMTVGGAGTKCIYASVAAVDTVITGGYYAVAEVGLEDFGLRTSIDGGGRFELCTLANIRSDETTEGGNFSNCHHGAGATNAMDIESDHVKILGNQFLGADSSLILLRAGADYAHVANNSCMVPGCCAYGINNDGIHVAANNYIQNNSLYGCATAAPNADLRIAVAYNTVVSTPETTGGPGGLPDNHDVRDNNYIATATNV